MFRCAWHVGSRHRFRFPLVFGLPGQLMPWIISMAAPSGSAGWWLRALALFRRCLPVASALHLPHLPWSSKWTVCAPRQSTRRWSHFLVLTLYLDANLQKEHCGQLPDGNFYTLRDIRQFDTLGFYLCICTFGAPRYNSPQLDFTCSSPSVAHSTRRSRTLQKKLFGQHPDKYCALHSPVADLQKDDLLGL